MKKWNISFFIFLSIFIWSCQVQTFDEKSKIIFTAPIFLQTQSNQTTKFKSVFSEQNNHFSCTTQPNKTAYGRPLVRPHTQQHAQQKKQEGLLAGWWKSVHAQKKPAKRIVPKIKPVAQQKNQRVLARADTSDDHEFQKVMQQRSQALQISMNDQKVTKHQITINSQTAGFLQAQGIDTARFASIEGLPIAYQLTGELVGVLDVMGEYALHHHEIYEKNLINYCAHLASLTQQSNMQGALQQAVQGTNCCHGIANYLQGMVAGVGQQYKKFQTAVHYFQPILEEYALAIEQHVVQSGAVIQGLEAIATAGLLAAPTATAAVTAIMIGVAAVTMAPLCLQAMAHLDSFESSCIKGDWKKVEADLDDFENFMTSPETIGHMAGFATGTRIPTPNLNLVVEQVLSLRPVVTSVQQASGKAASKLYVMTKNQIRQVYQQSVELLQSPEFMNFNVSWKNIFGCHFFKLFEQEQFALMPAFASGIENSFLNSVDQAVVTQLFTQAEGSIVADVVKSGTSQVINGMPSIITPLMHNAIHELIPLVSGIRQLQDLAKYTNNFTDLANLIPEDFLYLNRIHELQEYRAQIVDYLQTNKPYFIYEGEQYFIEDIASYHIHAGDYSRKNAPRGGHSNYGGHKLDCFKPELIKTGPAGAKDVVFYNSRNANLTKPSSIYPEDWSEFTCDFKAIEALRKNNAIITKNETGTTLEIVAYSDENLEIKIFYDIAHKKISSHYPNSETF